MKNRFLSLLITLIMVFSLSSPAFAQEPSQELLNRNDTRLVLNTSSVPEDSLTLQRNLENTEQAFSSLFQSFYSELSDTDHSTDDVYTVSGIPAGGFPDSYAGAYVNQDLNLVVLLSENSINSQNSLVESQRALSSAADSSLIYTTAKFSYNDLVSAMNDIHQYHLTGNVTDSNALFSIKYFAIDDYNNCVTVALDDTSASSIESFKDLVSDSPVIRFICDTSTDTTEDLSLRPGGAIDMGSVAFRIYKQQGTNFIQGFLTAAHCYDVGDTVYVGSTAVADASSSRQYGGNMDAVFCPIRSGHSVGTSIAYIGGTLRNAIDANLAQGHPVTMVGQTTQGETGTVQSISYSYTYSPNNTYFYDLGAANYSRDSGDSGGIVISTRTGSNYITGVHRGAANSYSLFSKAINITTGLNLTFNDGSDY